MARKLARWIINQPVPVWLGACGLMMMALYYFTFAQRYSLAEHGHKAAQSIATLNFMAAEGAFLYIFAFIALFGLYWIGYRVIRAANGNRLQGVWLPLIGFALIFNAALLRMYPVDAADIYDYIIRGRMTAFYSLNPLRDVPSATQNDLFLPFAAWRQVPSAYGPAWEIIAAGASRLAGDDPTLNVIIFKLVAFLGYLACLPLIWLTLRALGKPNRAMLGVYLFAWNPLVVFVTSGTGHNDALMTACMLLSIYGVTRRWYVMAVLAAILGALIKFIPLLLLPIIFVVAMRELNMRLRVRFILVSALLGGVIAAVTYAPFWFGIETLRAERRSQMFTGTWATIIRQELAPILDGKRADTWVIPAPVTNSLLSNITLGLFGAFYLWGLWVVFRRRDPVTPARVATLILVFYLLVVCLWFQSWYVVWALGLAVLLDDAPLRRLTLLLSYLVTWQPLLYNYVTLRPGAMAPIPWRDLVPVAVFMGGAYLYVGWFWLSTWLRSADRSSLMAAVGAQLREAREAAQLSPADLADELGLRTDDLLGYERGDRPLPLDTMRALCQRLSLSLPEVVNAGE